MSDAVPNPDRVSFGATTWADQPPFLGRISIDETTTSTKNKSGKQWHLAVKPLEFETKGDGLHNFLNIPAANAQGARSKRAAMFMVFEGIKKVFFAGKATADLNEVYVGEGQLIGLVGWFKRVDLDMGTDRTTGDKIVYEGAMIAVRLATPEEIATAGTLAGGPQQPVPLQANFSKEELEAVRDYVAGKTPVEYNKAAFRDKDLPQNIKNGITTGDAIRALVAAEMVTVGGDGMVTRREAAVA